MRLVRYMQAHARTVLLIGMLAAAALAVIRETSMTRNRLPLEVSQKVRNLSAKETEWQLAATAQPGDVLEHFMLIRLDAGYPEPVRGIRITAETSQWDSYREDSFASRVLGATGGSLNSRGIAVPELKPGEFIDLSWQTSISDTASFANSEAPLLESKAVISAAGFSEFSSRTVASLFSTLRRSSVSLAKKTFYEPKAYSMNPRYAYEDLGTGVLIAGEDLSGVTSLAIAGTGTALVWRLISNELLEAGIPAGLAPGSYSVQLFSNSTALGQTLSFEILPSKGRAVVAAATPSLIKSGAKRTLVLQGIHLDESLQLLLSKQGSARTHALENPKKINERVLTAEIPAAITSGTYTILVGDTEQEARLTVN